MSTQKRKNETEEEKVKKPKTELDTCQNVEYGPIESKELSLKFGNTDCKENNCEECVCPDQNDDQSIENGYLLIGEHENQISEGGEGELLKYKKNCKKNPGHPEFIPIELFSLKHLPEGHQDIELLDLIKATADLTVKLSVGVTSPERPEFWPNTKIPYHLSNLRGKKILRTGTGMVMLVTRHNCDDNEYDEFDEDYRDDTDVEDQDNENDKDKTYLQDVENEDDEYDIFNTTPCPCDKCKASDKPSKVWWELEVITAAHVVVDDIEASHTTLRLFYDSEDSEVVILKAKPRVDFVKIKQDRCHFTCVTCDENLGNKLEIMEKRFGDVWGKVYNKYIESRDIHKLNYIVSHPHGCSKQVSVGQWKDKVHVGEDKYDYKFTYTTCTCPGSSGANIHCVGYGNIDNFHSGSSKSGLNNSGVGRVYDENANIHQYF